MTIGGSRGFLEGLNNYFVTSLGPNFDDSVTKICTCDKCTVIKVGTISSTLNTSDLLGRVVTV